ncbi:MAG: DnaJ domain-containing protein [Anaerolineales bacterium]
MSTVRATNKPDYFAILDVPGDASTEEIKRAYREKVRRYHPDVSQEPDAAERFREVVEAYSVLSDPQQRAQYVLGETPRPWGPAPRPEPDWAAWQASFSRPQSRKRHSSAISFHVALLLFGLSIAYIVVEQFSTLLGVGLNAEPTTCEVLGWDAVGDQQRLNYQANVPWQLEPYQANRLFNNRQDEYTVGGTFQCFYFYNGELASPMLQRYDWVEFLGLVPWGVLSGVFILAATRFFWPR